MLRNLGWGCGRWRMLLSRVTRSPKLLDRKGTNAFVFLYVDMP